MSSRVYFHSLYKTRDYSYCSYLESPTIHFRFKGVDYRTLTFMQLRDKGEGVFSLEKLCVLPGWRHDGIGAKLLEKARTEAIRLGGHKITIGIIEENTRLKDWYLLNGFVHTGTIDLPHLPFIVGFMELPLNCREM